jgi:putative FmdB family regulatory protein
MPLYEYECESCGIRFERRQHMEDEPIRVCPECGGHVHRLIQPVGVIFKGSGFYVTDNRAKSPTAAPGTVKESPHTSDSGNKTSESDSDASSSD